MKNILKTMFAVLAIVGMGSLSFASETMATTAKAPEAAKAATVTGKVLSVNAEKKSFKVTEVTKGADGKDVTKEVEIWWAATTKLAWHNEAKTAATQSDLKAGAEVTVKAEANKDGNWVATEIWFAPAAIAPATK